MINSARFNEGGAPGASERPDSPAAQKAGPSPLLAPLWWAAGADARLLSHDSCWLERARYTASGLAVLITALLAAVSAATVLFSFVTRGSVLLACLGGLLWGLTILNLDRLLLTSLHKRSDGKARLGFWVIAPRVGLAVLAACAISIPAELNLFQRQLNVQVEVDQEREIADQQARLKGRFTEIPALEARRDQLSNEVAKTDSDAQSAFSAAACEADGSCGSHKIGTGALHEEKLAHYEELRSAARTLHAKTDPQIKETEGKIEKLKTERDQLLRHFQSTAGSSDDLLGRLMALRHLEQDPAHGGTVSGAAWLVRLLSLCLELLPLGLKITAPYGPYDAAFQAIQDGEAEQWHAVREKAIERAKVLIVQEQLLADSVRTTSQHLILKAAEDALTSRAARKAQADLSAEIVGRSVRVARAAAASVFDDRQLHDDIVSAARARRRGADERVVAAEADRSAAFGDLDAALRTASDLRNPQPLH